MRCVYCELPEIKEHEIVRNKLAWAFPTNTPIVPGHVLICPIRCVAKFEELTGEEKEAIFDLQARLKKALTKLFGAEGFNQAWNEGRAGGQSVPHFHLHLILRKTGDEGVTEYEPRKFLYRPGSRAESPAAELREIALTIRGELDSDT